MLNYVWLIPLLPLVGVILNVFVGALLPRRTAAWLAAALVGVAAGLTLLLIFEIRAIPEFEGLTVTLYRWLTAGAVGGEGATRLFSVDIAFYIDQLTVLMMMVITGVGFFIHMYSIGYMAEDAGLRRYFIYLNLFIFSMLLLVMGNNYLLMFLGWEGVGLCSYLLVSFWFTENKNADAGRKAFIVNRIGDFAVLLGIFLTWTTFGSLTYTEIFPRAAEAGGAILTLITILFFIGCTGKSAQIPLFVWLPDAMAGPTPVSALIHAATMVTAGVYLLVRSNAFLQVEGVTTPTIIAWIGVLTALFAGSIALTQTDIKRVLAYSTVSQLGYMFLAVGVGAYVAAIFHLFTHAFFKALLFLGSGSVMHAMEHGHQHTKDHANARGHDTQDAQDTYAPGVGENVDEGKVEDTFDVQDMRNMGGLWSRTRLTAITFLIGGLALAGFPLTSGFFSKDEILTLTQHASRPDANILYGLGLFTAFLTAFYTFRQFFMVFSGPPRTEAAEQAVESPLVMTIPLVVLAVFALLGGIVFGYPLENGIIHQWLEPVVELGAVGAGVEAGNAEGEVAGQLPEIAALAISGVVAIAGIGLAYLMYGSRAIDPAGVSRAFGPLAEGSRRKWYVDELYQAVFVRPYNALARASAAFFDRLVIDGAVNGVGAVLSGASRVLGQFQSGYVRGYAMSVIIGLLLIAAFFVWRVDLSAILQQPVQ